MCERIFFPVIVALIATALSGGAAADEAAAAEAELSTEDADSAGDSGDSIGLNLDLGFATAYVFRGYNVFQEDSQLDQNLLIAPGITWSVFDTGLWVGYWGAFQITGDNIRDNIDSGVGAEQDLLLGYDASLGESFTLSFGFAYYFYPFAEEEAAGCKVPSYLEPSLGFTFATVVDIGVNLTYFAGLQDAVSDYRYFYVNPSIGKSFELHEMVGLDVKLGYGHKFYDPDSSVNENFHDVLFTLGLPIYLPHNFYVTPSFGMAWTDIRDSAVRTQTSDYIPTGGAEGNTTERTAADQFVFWGGLNVGVDL